MRNNLYIAVRSAGAYEVIPYVGDLIEGAEADGDRLSAHVPFVNVIDLEIYCIPHILSNMVAVVNVVVREAHGTARLGGIDTAVVHASFRNLHRALYGGGDGGSGFDRAVKVRADLGFQLFRPEGAVRVRELGDEAGSVRGDEAEHGMVVLILHDAHDEVDFLVREVSADRVDEGFNAVRVVGAIDDEKRFPREDLEAARPGSLRETGTDGILGDAPATALQAVDDVEHSHRVFHLVVAEQMDTEIRTVPVVEDLPVDRPRAGGEGRRIGDDEPCG